MAARPAAPARTPQGEAPKSPGRSLVPFGRPRATTARTRSRPSAPFLAHLIATAQQLPQMRRRRRIEPQHGAASYAMPAPPASGRSLYRSI